VRSVDEKHGVFYVVFLTAFSKVRVGNYLVCR